MTNSSTAMGIYIHIPFCLQKCDYCDFYSLPLKDPSILEQYTRSVIRELQQRAPLIRGPFASIFFGGGTPSLLQPGQVERIIETVLLHYQASGELEISMEVNPATVNLQALIDLHRVGVNRLSIGVQSFSDKELKALGRVHGGTEASAILRDISKAGFDNFNIDLIYGQPGQTLNSWQENLRLAMEFNPQHISAYLLQLEENTPLARKVGAGLVHLLDDELESEMYYSTLEYMEGQGYRHYEISNFAKPGYECRHNLLYWRGCDYLGIGTAAVSYYGGLRTLNLPPVNRYIDCMLDGRYAPVEILESMDLRQSLADAIIMGLRLTEGISRKELRNRFGIDIFEEYRDIIKRCQMQGLLEQENDRIYLTKRAYFLSNQVLNQFIA